MINELNKYEKSEDLDLLRKESVVTNSESTISKDIDDNSSYSPTSIPDCITSDAEYSTDEAQQPEEPNINSPVVATTSEDSSSLKSLSTNDKEPLTKESTFIYDSHSYSPNSVCDDVNSSTSDITEIIHSSSLEEIDNSTKLTEDVDNDDNDDEDSLAKIEESKKFFKHFSNVFNLKETPTETHDKKIATPNGFASTPILNPEETDQNSNTLELSPKQMSIKSSSEDSFSTLHAWKRKKTNVLQDTDSENENENENQHKSESENESELVYRFNGKRIYKRKSHIGDINDDEYKFETVMHIDDDAPHSKTHVTESPRKTTKSKNFVSDFDQMQQKKRAEKSKTRSNRNLDFITKNDDLIAELIDQMEDAAYEDRCLNEQGLPAIKKVGMLKYVTSQLIKKDLQQTFLEHNILSTLTEWLSPLPSKCLPCVQIRENILRILADFPTISSTLLKESGIGKALMFLRKHPQETKANRERCNRLIAQWARPIHNLTCDYTAMSKKERQERDIELSLRYKKQAGEQPKKSKIPKTADILDQALKGAREQREARPGEPGWIPRARVPQPSTKDYVRRPESQTICPLSTKIKPNRYETLAKKYQNAAKRSTLCQRSMAGLSVFGNKM